MKNIEGKLTITRRRNNDDVDYMNIELEDEDAGITPIEIKVSCEALMKALTGFGYQPCEFSTRHLEHVGMVKERDSISFPIPDADWGKRKGVAIEEAKNHTPEGWIAAESYNSQNSFTRNPDGSYNANTQIVRWVNKETK